MKKLKTFYNAFWKSSIRPSFYKELIKTKFSFSLKYILFLFFLIALIKGVIFDIGAVYFIPQIPQFLDRVKTESLSIYPKNLVINFNNGVLKTNVKEPYTIDLPPLLGDIKSDNFIYLVTIDTKGAVENYPQYKSIFLITSNSIVVPDNQSGVSTSGSFKVVPISEFVKDDQNVTINQKAYQNFLGTILPYLNYLRALAIVLVVLAILVWPFIGAILGASGDMFLLVFGAFLIWIFAKIMRRKLSYGKIYQLSMYAITAPVVLAFVLSFLKINLGIIYSLVYLVFMGLVVTRFEKASQI